MEPLILIAMVVVLYLSVRRVPDFEIKQEIRAHPYGAWIVFTELRYRGGLVQMRVGFFDRLPTKEELDREKRKLESLKNRIQE